MLTTFGTHLGRCRFLRMKVGTNSVSEFSQRTMEQFFAGYPCSIIRDGILVAEQNDANLKLVLDRARAINLKLNPQKCRFRVNEVNYVGHVCTSDGLKPDLLKTIAINELPVPTDVTALQRFVDIVIYLGNVIPIFSEVSAPLRQLTYKDTDWSWHGHQQRALATNVLRSNTRLLHCQAACHFNTIPPNRD